MLRQRDELFPAEVLSRYGSFHFHNFRSGSLSHNGTAVFSGSRADIDDLVRRQHGLFVMFYHQHAVPQVTQMVEGLEQPPVIPLVEADTGLVQNIKDPYQPAADLGGQPYTLGFPAA